MAALILIFLPSCLVSLGRWPYEVKRIGKPERIARLVVDAY
ncbi:hypothetical protein [Mycobacterium montefiorense]|nr:hypothetical protein [Mycobacterium montefiorense]